MDNVIDKLINAQQSFEEGLVWLFQMRGPNPTMTNTVEDINGGLEEIIWSFFFNMGL